MPRRPLRIGTRGSPMALAQTGMVRDRIAAAHPDLAEPGAMELVVVTTVADKVLDRPLSEIGGKGLFTKELEQALLADEVDIAVHSMKDVPAEQPDGLCIAAIPEREDARDAFVSRDVAAFQDLPMGARLGTASLRRQAQALALRPDLKIEMLRGNIDTRLRRAAEGDFDAILLAVSGMRRLGVDAAIRQTLSPDAFLPAPGQGALAIQTRVADVDAAWAAALNHAPSALAVAAERGAMTALEGSCRTAVGAHARLADGVLHLTAEMLSPDGSARWRRVGQIAAGEDLASAEALAAARELGLRLGAEIHAAAGDQEVDPATLPG